VSVNQVIGPREQFTKQHHQILYKTRLENKQIQTITMDGAFIGHGWGLVFDDNTFLEPDNTFLEDNLWNEPL